MRDELFRELVCPQCLQPLHALPFERDTQIREGLLLCPACRVFYPVLNYIPIMLVHAMGEAILWLKEVGFHNITPLELEKLPKRYLHVWLHNVGLRSQRPLEENL